MSKTPTPPSIQATAFDCPHCSAFTTQSWYELYAGEIQGSERTPAIAQSESKKRISESTEIRAEHKKRLYEYVDKILTGLVFLSDREDVPRTYIDVGNLHLK